MLIQLNSRRELPYYPFFFYLVYSRRVDWPTPIALGLFSLIRPTDQTIFYTYGNRTTDSDIIIRKFSSNFRCWIYRSSSLWNYKYSNWFIKAIFLIKNRFLVSSSVSYLKYIFIGINHRFYLFIAIVVSFLWRMRMIFSLYNRFRLNKPLYIPI
jgi:hypothetical protein